MRSILWLHIAILILSPSRLLGGEFIDISDEHFQGHFLGLKTYWYRGDQSIETVSSSAFENNFALGDRPTLSFGIDKNVYWYRLDIYNSSQKETKIFLNELVNRVSEFSLYINTELIGRLTPEHTIKERVISFTLKPEATTRLFIKMQTNGYQRMTWRLWLSPEDMTRSIEGRTSQVSVFLSILLMSLFFNLMLIVAFKERLHVYYSFYLMTFAVWVVWANSLFYLGGLTTSLGPTIETLVGSFVILFTIEFLNLSVYKRIMWLWLRSILVVGLLFVPLFSLFDNLQIVKVVNLAAQAGVRYSIENPFAYVDSNLVGFVNILEACRKNKIEH